MEDNNYKDEFELFLKESADEFRMVPSRKVWYSLYNNLHPDRKWPSMAVCLLILTAVLYLGIANNNSLSSAAKKASSENFSNILNEKNTRNTVTFSASDYIQTKNKKQQKFSLTINKNENTKLNDDFVTNNIEVPITLTTSEDVSVVNTTENSPTLKIFSSFIENGEKQNVDVLNSYQKKNPEANKFAGEPTPENTTIENKRFITRLNIETVPAKLLDAASLLEKLYLLNIEKSWKEDYAFRNKPAINKFKQNSSLSYYITPSSGYRTFAKTTEQYTPAISSSFSAAQTNNEATVLLDNAALNLEAGAILQYNISKTIRIKGGLQANYTNYISSVTALGHPSLTSVTLNNNNNTNIRSSNYSTKAGNDKINKTTMQVALPLGADIKIAGNKKLNWYAGGSIQPTYVIGGNAFVLSTDEKYYVSENALLRKMNLNTSIETFISFKSSNGVILNVGPQFRYQLLSTYKKEYGYSEKVYNVGLKIGVSTTF